MPVSVVVGGQFGSEGKGKVALELAKRRHAVAAVRVGGSNSGHTAVDANGFAHVFRHLPTAALLPGVVCVIGAGSYVDPEVLLSEIETTHLSPSRLLIDPRVVLIEERHRQRERQLALRNRIGSTLSGTGAAIVARVERQENLRFAADDKRLAPYVRKVIPWLRARISKGERLVVEGTQGFGLSLLHSEHYPYVTGRDTSAAAFVAEAGLSPLDVDEIALVIRAFPIRVAGASGHLPNEIDWETITRESGSQTPIIERTSVTQKIRRVARFDPTIVRQAIETNAPTLICLNHVDYIDVRCLDFPELTEKAETFIQTVEQQISRQIDFVGTSPNRLKLRYSSTTTLNKNAISAFA